MSHDCKITVAVFSDEYSDPFNEDLSTDEEGSTQKDRLTILQSGSQEERVLIDRKSLRQELCEYDILVAIHTKSTCYVVI